MFDINDKVKFPFGKYKGQYIEDIYKNHYDYIQWLKNKGVNGFVYDEIKRLDDSVEQGRLQKLEVIQNRINDLISDNTKVYAQDIHAVGLAYIIGDVHLEDVMSSYTVYSVKEDINIRLTKDEYDKLYTILNKNWHNQPKELWQEGRLY